MGWSQMNVRLIGMRATRLIRLSVTASIVCTLGLLLALARSNAASCGGEDGMTFENWRDRTEVTDGFVISEGHSNSWVRIYVDDLAKDIYLAGSAPYPECAEIIKSAYHDADGSSFRGLTVMVKMPTGYDPENADWWYGKYDESGTLMLRQGRLFDCVACHKQASDTDYLFSREVLGIKEE